MGIDKTMMGTVSGNMQQESIQVPIISETPPPPPDTPAPTPGISHMGMLPPGGLSHDGRGRDRSDSLSTSASIIILEGTALSNMTSNWPAPTSVLPPTAPSITME